MIGFVYAVIQVVYLSLEYLNRINGPHVFSPFTVKNVGSETSFAIRSLEDLIKGRKLSSLLFVSLLPHIGDVR